MFRNSLRRCAASARSAATASLLVQTRTLPIAGRRIASIPSPIAPLNRIASIARAYSSESPAVEETPVAEQSNAEATSNADRGTLFRDLRGVHHNLLATITNTMGYDYMTPVQAKTIEPALKGTDM